MHCKNSRYLNTGYPSPKTTVFRGWGQLFSCLSDRNCLTLVQTLQNGPFLQGFQIELQKPILIIFNREKKHVKADDLYFTN